MFNGSKSQTSDLSDRSGKGQIKVVSNLVNNDTLMDSISNEQPQKSMNRFQTMR